MQEKIEWEIVDDPKQQARSQWSSYTHAQQQAGAPSGIKHLLRGMMGPWWRWKLVGIGLFAALALVMIAMLTGVVAIVVAVGAALAIIVSKVRQWTRRHGNALAPR